MKCFLIVIAMLIVSSTTAVAHADMVPETNWCVRPIAVVASGSKQTLLPLLKGEPASWKPADNVSGWIAFQLPKGRRYLLTFTCIKGQTPVSAVLESSRSGRHDADWKVEGTLHVSGRLDKFEFGPSDSSWWRLRFVPDNAAQTAEYSVSDIALHALDKPGRKDYWLVIGASIQAQSIRQNVFHQMVKKRFPKYDPVVFNLAVGGWRSDDLLKALPGFLAEHPNASYVCIHIGGNNVSLSRPYPNGAEQLRDDLVAIIEMIKDSGKIPILSRLSYRAYKGDKPVPPEENGSGPYVTNIYDPIIAKYCPDFCDPKTGLGLVDGYTWFKTHQDELSPDGVHVNEKGAESWNRLWVEGAGSVIYGD